MPGGIRTLKVEVVGDYKRFTKSASEAEARVGQFSGTISKASGFVRNHITSLLALSGGLVGAGFETKKLIDIGNEANQTERQTAAAIKSTGDASGLTAKSVGNLALRLALMSGVNKDVVQGGANLLLTFTHIGKDVFPVAEKAALDMTAGMNRGQITSEGLKATSIQLGKALQDPAKGLTALHRVGVTFSKGQKTQIDDFIKHGRVAKAQGIILAEVNREFGGSAKAAATPIKQLGVILHEAETKAGQFIVGGLDKVAKFITRTVLPAFDGFTSRNIPKLLGDVGKVWRAFVRGFQSPQFAVSGGGFIGSIVRLGQSVGRFVDENGPKVKEFFKHLIADVKDFAERNGPNLLKVLKEGATWFGKVAKAVGDVVGWLNKHQTLVQTLAVVVGTLVIGIKTWILVTKTVTAVTKLWGAAQAALNVVLDANPIGLVILAVAALAAGIIYAYKHSKTFRDIVQGAFKDVKIAVKDAVDFIITLVKAWFDAQSTVIIGIISLFAKLPGPMGAPFRALKGVAERARDNVNRALDGIKRTVDVTFKGHDKVLSTVQQIDQEMKAHGYSVTARLIRGGTRQLGGIIGGTGFGDKVPIWAEPGETVVPVRAHTPGFVSWAKSMKIPGYKAGGVVGWPGSVNFTASRDVLVSRFGGGGAATVGGNLGQWIEKAIQLTRVGANWASRLATLIMRESGGNPRAINLTDQNAARGDPSRGLMQTIMATFERFRLPSLVNNIFDPIANIVAGIRYILSRYGSIFRVQQANPGLPPKGYSGGLWNAMRDSIIAIHAGEMVVPARIAGPLRTAAARGGDGAAMPTIQVVFNGPVNRPEEVATVVERELTRAFQLYDTNLRRGRRV